MDRRAAADLPYRAGGDGCISEACCKAGVSSRSAYRLRQRADAVEFARGWDQALRLATLRLTTIAFERAVRGTVREFWRNDELVATTRTPWDKLLTFLLGHLLRATTCPADWTRSTRRWTRR